ncbi:MAG TPA: transposase [Candidatus Saccharimonadales bacterium]|nr:transposase [Candidatus Saccharimonadales bacterium]
MPRRNAIKTYVPDGYYHIYNRGVARQPIFLDQQDYGYFTKLLVYYLTCYSWEANLAVSRRHGRAPDQDLSREVKLISYCLMPNHFHLLIKQLSVDGLTKLMKRVSASYALYFNHRHNRIGHLYESYCKAVSVLNSDQLAHASRYIHLNPKSLGVNFRSYPYSNYQQIISGQATSWTDCSDLLDYFDQDPIEYRNFVEEYDDLDRKSLPPVATLVPTNTAF